jgi:LuxR family transcriptional regulator, maltose regulon positive regulatory protein
LILTPPTRKRLLALLNPVSPAIFIEGSAGTHKSALMKAWVAQPTAHLRVLVEFDHRQMTPQVMARRLAYQLELSGVPGGDLVGDEDNWELLSRQLERAIAAGGKPITLGVQRMDELPAPAAQTLIKLAGSLPGFRLVATAVDAQQLAAEAVGLEIGHQVIGDLELAYSAVEVAGILNEELPEASEATVRAILEATHGVPVLVERVISLFPQECLAAMVSVEQAVVGWEPQTEGAATFHAQLRLLAQAPQLSPTLLTGLYGPERAEYLFVRLPRMGAGVVSHPLSGRRLFTWHPAYRRHLLQVAHGDSQALAQAQVDRARVAQCAAECGDPELAVAMLVANQSLSEAESMCAQWLWELADVSGGLLLEHFMALDPQGLMNYPNLLIAATFVQPGRGEPSADPELLKAQRTMLSAPISGGVTEQLTRLAKAATMALGIGELGVAIRATIRWANLLQAKNEEWAEAVGPEFVADGLLMVKALVQLDRIDLVTPVVQALLGPMRRSPNRVGGDAESRLSVLFATMRMSAVLLGTSRAEVRSLQLSPRQYHREFDQVLRPAIDAGEALDRGDFASAEAFTRVAMFRLPHPADWPVLIYLRAVALVALGDREKLDELADQLLTTPRWEAWQHHEEAPGMYALLAESMVMAATGRAIVRPFAELPAYIRALPPGATHRWPAWGRRLLEGTIQVGSGAARGAELPTDAELGPLSPRVSWQLGLLAALNSLRSGEEATAVSVMIRAGAGLRYTAAPLPLVLAAPAEIGTLIDRLPPKAGAVVRASLALAESYAGIESESRGTVRLAGRELEVLDGVRRGLTNTAIARELYVSVNTVKFHRTNLYRKLNATSREEVLAEALSQGL